ncbi:GATA transcription factor 8 [Vitis vinifera]|uniref:GATA transcription factor 8 n=1 Tax=Vitis vinifera TaxID=29760 RepID=A0A438IKV7_VITVI|nr:GATA transcription factor 8 [Vitis vinifera]
MIDSGLFDENGNGNDHSSDDMFDGIIDIFDFPMEDVDIGGEVEELQRESSPLNDFLALPCPFSGNSCNDTSNLRTIPSDEAPRTEPIVIDTCSGNISLHGDSSDDKESLLLQNSTTSESGKSASEPFAQTIEASEGYPNFMKGKQKKKKRKKLSLLSGAMGVKKQWWQQPITIGRCMHCNVTRTPQWREGPNGPKTLCNACGVCYKRGSLFPEYRPASSPTFVPSLHTNSRRKVTEMRHKAGQEAAVGASPTFLTTPLHTNSRDKVIKMSNKAGQAGDSCSEVVEIRNKGIQVGATFLATSDSKPDEKVTEADMEASTAVSPIPVATLPSPHRKQPVTVRKCMHCEATQTPLWRQGPWGPKSLCNACGIRYKSGRLFPEYHPAASPTFVASLHSNSHKKVLEMRNQATQQQLSLAATDTAMSHPSQLIP